MCIIYYYVLHWYGSKVDHLLMPGCPEVENSYQDPFPSLSVFQYSVLIINGCGLEMGVKKKNPPFPSPRSALDIYYSLYIYIGNGLKWFWIQDHYWQYYSGHSRFHFTHGPRAIICIQLGHNTDHEAWNPWTEQGNLWTHPQIRMPWPGLSRASLDSCMGYKCISVAVQFVPSHSQCN